MPSAEGSVRQSLFWNKRAFKVLLNLFLVVLRSSEYENGVCGNCVESQYLFDPLDMRFCWNLIPESTLSSSGTIVPKELMLKSFIFCFVQSGLFRNYIAAHLKIKKIKNLVQGWKNRMPIDNSSSFWVKVTTQVLWPLWCNEVSHKAFDSCNFIIYFICTKFKSDHFEDN